MAATRNFSRTGDAVGLTQPAVSRCITELEAQLGLKLLNRTTREVTLTDAGQRLAARLPRVLEAQQLVLHCICDGVDVQLLGDDPETEVST